MSTLSFTNPASQPEGPSSGETAPAADLLSASARAYLVVKTVLDFITALTLLVLTGPLILVSMLLVKLTSAGPALYSQTRLGRHGQPFTIYKLRTMGYDCESLTGPRWSTPGDARITPIGRWLRRTHLDELPQLWNVLRGDMSLIGPRPERPEFVPNLERALPCYRKRLQVRPGVTGLAQVQLPPDSDLDSVRTKTAYDLHYVRRVGVLLDARIAWATFFKVIGVPFPHLRVLFRFPPPDAIEKEYHALTARPVAVKIESDEPTSRPPDGDTASADNVPVAG